MTKPQVIHALGRRFPDAEPEQIRKFVDARWDGDIDADQFEAMAESFAEGLDDGVRY